MVHFQLELRGVTDARVLEAMRKVPRDRFVPASRRSDAWSDWPVPIGHGQTISQPYMVAVMTAALRLSGKERALEVGTGSGYQAAVLGELAAEVWTIERIPELATLAQRVLSELGYTNVHVLVGDGSVGLPGHAPYDGILVAAAAPSVPVGLRNQLADNGTLVVPVGASGDVQVLTVVRRIGRSFTVEEGIGCRFVPLLGAGAFESGELPDLGEGSHDPSGR